MQDLQLGEGSPLALAKGLQDGREILPAVELRQSLDNQYCTDGEQANGKMLDRRFESEVDWGKAPFFKGVPKEKSGFDHLQPERTEFRSSRQGYG